MNGERTRVARLDLRLGHLERAERDVGEELGGCRTSEPNEALVVGTGLLAGKVHVLVLEDLVETVLEHALERVADEGRAKALPEPAAALLSGDGADTREETLVLARVDLHDT